MSYPSPSGVKMLEQKEINEVVSLLSDCGILPLDLIKVLFTKRDKTARQIDVMLNQIVKRKQGFYDESHTYLLANKGVKTSDRSNAHEKAIWLMLDLIKNIKSYYIQFTTPLCLTFYYDNTDLKEGESNNPIYDVYYIPYNSEKLNEFTINSSTRGNDVNAFIILDSESQIDKLNFNNNIHICAYVLISPDGKVEYISC